MNYLNEQNDYLNDFIQFILFRKKCAYKQKTNNLFNLSLFNLYNKNSSESSYFKVRIICLCKKNIFYIQLAVVSKSREYNMIICCHTNLLKTQKFDKKSLRYNESKYNNLKTYPATNKKLQYTVPNSLYKDFDFFYRSHQSMMISN